MPGLRVFPEGITSYREAKIFLFGANIIYRSSLPTIEVTRYQFPDGSIYFELNSLLESPEDHYVLEKVK
jgi:hypothetical protein